MSNTILVLIVILFILIILFVLGFVFYEFYYKKKNKIRFSNDKNNKKIIKLENKKIEELEKIKKEYQQKIIDLNKKIENVHNIDIKEIKQQIELELIRDYKSELNNKLNEIKKEFEEKKTEICNNILIDVLERSAEPLILERTTSSITLEDESLKGRLIGREGRNKRIFELLTGTDLIIDKDSNLVSVSSANPIRREIALNTLKKIIQTKNIVPNKIENAFATEKECFENKVIEIGKDIWINNLKLEYIDSNIYYYIGRLKFRSSYGQNALSHCVECALIASDIALKLNLDIQKAKMIAFLHDIGKANDYEVNKNHIDSGLDIAKECNLPEDVKDAILSHHGDKDFSNIYSQITKIADTISAARPGARINSYEEYYERVKALEDICNEFEEVNSSYVIKSGRQLRVLINPSKVLDKNMAIIANKIKNRLEQNPKTNNYKIKVVLIKENKYEFETSVIE